MPIKLSDRERSLLYLTIAALLFYVSFNFFFQPKWEEIGKLKDQARAARLDLKISEEKIRILDAVEKKYGALPGKTAMSPEERALEIFKNISLSTSASHLNLLSIQPVIVPGQDGFKFNLVCSGRYSNLYDFLVYLQQFKMLIFIDSMAITRGGEADLNIKIALTAYY